MVCSMIGLLGDSATACSMMVCSKIACLMMAYLTVTCLKVV